MADTSITHETIEVTRQGNGQWTTKGPCGSYRVYVGESAEILDVLFKRGKHAGMPPMWEAEP